MAWITIGDPAQSEPGPEPQSEPAAPKSEPGAGRLQRVIDAARAAQPAEPKPYRKTLGSGIWRADD